MKLHQRKFIEFAINKQALNFGEFTLKSGRKSPYFFNVGLFNVGKDIEVLGHFYAESLFNSGIDFNLLFGPAYKGIPIAISTVIALSKYYQRNVSYSFNRKEKKFYGESGYLVGSSLKGRIILIDDVITAGTAIHESIKIIHTNGATLAGIIVSLDREEKGIGKVSAIQEIERCYDCKVISIITLKNVIEFLEEKPEMIEYLKSIFKYQEQFGI